MEFTIKSIGKVRADDNGTRLELEKEYTPALTKLAEFGHIFVLFWFHKLDDPASRSKLVEKSPYKDAPELLGTFATRSPQRPNPIGMTCCAVTFVDMEKGVIGLEYIDVLDGTPVLDIKPYTPSLDRVENPSVPAWCAGWPKSLEESGEFDWSSVFTFDS